MNHKDGLVRPTMHGILPYLMIRPILYMGGMCGDVILAMINPDHMMNGWLREELCWKNPHQWPTERMNEVMLTDQGYAITHNADWCWQHHKRVTQLTCTNDQIEWCASRLYTANPPEQVPAIEYDQYCVQMRGWIEMHKFPNRFSIENIMTRQFVEDVCNAFTVTNEQHAYSTWLNWRDREHSGDAWVMSP